MFKNGQEGSNDSSIVIHRGIHESMKMEIRGKNIEKQLTKLHDIC